MLHLIAVVKSITSTSTPTLTLVINDDPRPVAGVTSIDNRLFVLRKPSQQQIQVYETKTFKQQRALQVTDLCDDTVSGLTSCVTNNCVYVSDWHKKTVYKVEMYGNNQVFNWCVDGEPRGLSINTACNLLIACWPNKIVEYTARGSFVREICLKSNDVELYPMHAIQVNNDQFVVSCVNVTNGVNDVVEVDTKGRVADSYTYQLQSTTQNKFNWPRRLSVDKNKEFIIVADCKNNRIVILNRSLNCCARELNVISVDGGLQQPSCLHFDTSQNRLFVGEWSESQCRVMMFDNVI
jgi:NHL repeat